MRPTTSRRSFACIYACPSLFCVRPTNVGPVHICCGGPTHVFGRWIHHQRPQTHHLRWLCSHVKPTSMELYIAAYQHTRLWPLIHHQRPQTHHLPWLCSYVKPTSMELFCFKQIPLLSPNQHFYYFPFPFIVSLQKLNL